MSNPERMQHDKAAILSIIKYFLISIVAVIFIYVGFRLFVILLPFVFGYILARLSIAIVTSAKNLTYDFRQYLHRRKQRKNAPAGAPATTPDTQKEPLPVSRRKLGRYPQGLARTRGEKRLIIVVYILLIVLILGMFAGVIVAGVGQLRSLAAFLPEIFGDADFLLRLVNYLENLSTRLGGFIPPQYLSMLETELANLQQRILQEVPGVVTAILNGIASFAGNLPIIFFVIVVIIMSGYYFITDSRNMYIFMRRNVISKQFREKTVRLINTLFSTLFRVIGGYLFLLILTFAMALVGLLLIRMPYAVIIALVAAVVDFLPVLGLSATMIPVAIYLFINGQILQGLGALIVLAVMTMIRRVIEPAVLGNAMRLHPMATLASMIVGIAVYGLAGILIGPIIMVVAKEILSLYGIDNKLRTFFGDILNRFSA